MEKLKTARKAKKLTQAKLAKALHITKSAVSKYETGQLDPNCKTIIELCKILEVSSDYLLGIKEAEEEESKALTPHEEIIIDSYRNAPEDMQEAIRRILKIEQITIKIKEEQK